MSPETLQGLPLFQFAARVQAALLLQGGWKGCSVPWLTKRLVDEVSELHTATIHVNGMTGDVLSEAADVANFAMMIADVGGWLP